MFEYKEYFDTIKDYKSLSKEEEHKLLLQYKLHGDIAARNELIKANLKFVTKMASNYKKKVSDMELGEILSEAHWGLINGIDNFDLSQDVKLISYAKWHVLQKMQTAVERRGKIHEDSLPDETEEYDDDETFSPSVNKYDCNILDDYDNEVYQKEAEKDVDMVCRELTDRERDIINRYYGIGYEKTLSMEEIGLLYGITKERTRQIIDKAMIKMRSTALLCRVNR